MIRTRRFRSFLAMLLAFCLVSASLWSVSAEAMADALSDEVGLVHVATGTDHSPGDKTCNHGCHAQSHLAGLDCGLMSVIPPGAEESPRVDYLLAVPARSHDGPFRPPRTAFQA